MRAAERAGLNAASTPTTRRHAGTSAYVTGSCGVTPTSAFAAALETLHE